MDEKTLNILMGLAVAHTGILITIGIKFWNFAKKHSITEYQHKLMWKRFSKEFIDGAELWGKDEDE